MTDSVVLALVHRNIQAVLLVFVPFIDIVADVVGVYKWLLAIETQLSARITIHSFLDFGKGSRSW